MELRKFISIRGKSTWSLQAVSICDLWVYINGSGFGPERLEFIFQVMATTSWQFFCHWAVFDFIRTCFFGEGSGCEKKNGSNFSAHGGLVVKDPMTKFLVAKVQTIGFYTTLQIIIHGYCWCTLDIELQVTAYSSLSWSVTGMNFKEPDSSV